MTEREYTAASNLARLREAQNILNNVYLYGDLDRLQKDKVEAYKAIDRMIEAHRKIVNNTENERT